MSGKPFHERVAETLIEQLKLGTAPWQKPWKPGESYLPFNPKSGTRYKGINAVTLLAQGYSDPRFLTYRQAQALGAQVGQGEKGSSVQYWSFSEEQDRIDKDGKPVLGPGGKPEKVTVKLERPRVFYATVFNAEQIEGLPPLSQSARSWDPIERAEAIVKASGATIMHGGDRAFYNLHKDAIRLPSQGQFPDAASYYATALHELGHWTGHPSRLNRDIGHPFGSDAYAREELRAEIASMLLGHELGLGHDPSQHAAYVGSWIKVLQEDSLEVFRAASAAEQIQTYVLGFEQKQELTEQQTQEQSKEYETMTVSQDSAEGSPVPSARQTLSEGIAPSEGQAERNYIDVPYRDRKAARTAGARWDREQRSWYIPKGAETSRFARWQASGASIPLKSEQASKLYLAVPYGERNAAKAAGAQWDKRARSWYAGPGADLQKLQRWQLGEGAEQSPAVEPRQELAVTLRDMAFVMSGQHPVMDGQKHRLAVQGDKQGEKSGFYVAHLDGHPAAYIKNHRTGVEITWKSKGYVASPADKARLRAEAAQKLQARAAAVAEKHEAASTRLQSELASLQPATVATPYMRMKGIGTHPGVFTDKHGTTYIPATDASGKLSTVQYIDPKGTKRFAKGARKSGSFHVVGASLQKAEVIVIAEGYATAATVAELLGRPTVAAFDSGNLCAVATTLHDKYPEKPIVIVADDDQAQQAKTGKNPGREKAAEAANAVRGMMVLPLFAPGEQRERPREFSDFNDLAVRSVLGRDSAASQIRHVYERALRESESHKVRQVTQHQEQKRSRAL